jgi:flagellar export protein FliJ
MKAFRNPLENILEIRRLQQGQRETELFAAQRERDREQAKLDGILARQRDAARYQPSSTTPAAGQALLVRERFVEHQRRLAGRQRLQVVAAQEEVENRKTVLVEARREVRTFETHRSRLFERWQAEFRREEQKLGDETGAARHGAGNREETQPGTETGTGLADRW